MQRGPGAPSDSAADVGTEQGNIDLIRAAEVTFGPIDLFFANAGVGMGSDLDTPEDVWEHGLRRQHPRPPLGGEAPGPRLGRARRGLLLLHRLRRRAAQPDRLGALLDDQARRRRVRRVAEHHLRRPRRPRQLPVPAGREHQHAQRRRCSPVPIRRAAWSARPGWCSNPTQVAEVVLAAVDAEQFLILPHPEVLTYLQRKTGDYDRWLAGMRRLQARMALLIR